MTRTRGGSARVTWGLAILTSFVVVGRPVDVRAAAAPTTTPSADERVWKLTPYLKGNAAQVRDLLNGELERLLARKEATTRLVAGFREKIKVEEQAAVAAVRKDPQYLKLHGELQKAEAEMAAARAGGSPQARMDASSRFNKVRGQIERMERTAVGGANLATLRKQLADQEESLKRCDASVAKAEKWRNDLLGATRNAFRLMYPLDPGEVGMLGTITPVKIVGPDSLLIEYEAFEILKEEGGAEGVRTVNVRPHKVSVLVSGVDTAGMAAGVPVTPDVTFAVVKAAAGDRPCQLKRHPTDADRLMEVILPLRVDAAADAAAPPDAPATRPTKSQPKS